MLVPSYDVKNVAQLHVGLGRFFDHFWNNSTLQCQRTFIINTNYEWGSICDLGHVSSYIICMLIA